MNSLKACIKKEIFEGIKTYKFLIVAMGILFFAVADPVFLKLTPMILEKQFGSIDSNMMKNLNLSQLGSIAKYSSDLFQLGMLITAFTLAGLISSERAAKTLTIPVSMGCKVSSLILAKVIVYGSYNIIMTIFGMLIAYYYSGLIFEPDGISAASVIGAGVCYGILFLTMLSILILFSSFMKKGFLAGILTLLAVYVMPSVGSLFRIERYLPSNLMKIAAAFGGANDTDIIVTMVCTFTFITVMVVLAISRLKRTELV